MADTETFSNGFNAGMKKAKGGGKDKAGPKAPDTKAPKAAPAKMGTDIKSFKNGGRVRKTGVYRLHAGEEVIPAKKVHKKSRRKATSKR